MAFSVQSIAVRVGYWVGREGKKGGRRWMNQNANHTYAEQVVVVVVACAAPVIIALRRRWRGVEGGKDDGREAVNGLFCKLHSYRRGSLACGDDSGKCYI